MKKRLIFCLFVLLLTASIALAENWYCPNCGRSCTDNFCARCGTARPSDLGGSGLSDEYIGGYPIIEIPTDPSYSTYSTSGVWMTANRVISTRSGPGTSYSEPGSFGTAGFRYKVLSRNDIWVQVEASYCGMQFRAYTGIQRFDYTQRDLNSIPVEAAQYTGTVRQYSLVRSGPGIQYTYLHQDTLDRDIEVYVGPGTSVIVYAIENGYAQIDFWQNGYQYRGWVLQSAVARSY